MAAQVQAVREMVLRLRYEADSRGLQNDNKQLAADLDRIAQGATKAEKALKGAFSSSSGRAGGGGVGIGATSPVPGFDRPVPVIIMGPRPLPVSGFGGTGTNATLPGASGGKPGDDTGGGMSLGVIGAKFAAVAASAAALVSTVAGLSKGFADLENNALNAREKTLGLVKAIPLIGESAASVMNNLYGMVERYRDPGTARALMDAKAGHGNQMGMIGLSWQFHGRTQDLDRETRDAQIRARGFEFIPGSARTDSAMAVLGGGMSMNGVNPQLRASIDDVQRGKRELAIVEEQAKVARGNVDMHKRIAEERAETARKAISHTNHSQGPAMARPSVQNPFNIHGLLSNGMAGNPVGALAGLGISALSPVVAGGAQQNPFTLNLIKEREAIQDLERAQAELEKSMTISKQKQLEFEQKRYDLMQRETAIMKTRLSLIEQEEQRARAGQREFGGMDKVSQQNLLDITKRFQAGGRENVTEGEYGLIRGNSLTSGFVGQEAEKNVSGNAALKALLQTTGQRDLQTIVQEQVKLKSEIKVKVELDEEQFQKMFAKAVENANQDAQGLLGKMIAESARRVAVDTYLGNQMRGQ